MGPIPKWNFLKIMHFKWHFYRREGWSGGVMVVGKLPEPGRPTNSD